MRARGIRAAGLWAALVSSVAIVSSAAPGASPPPSLDSRLEEVRRLDLEGRYQKAELAARRLLSELEAGRETDSLDVARTLDQLTHELRRTGKAGEPEARLLCERALRIKSDRLGAQDPEYAVSLQRLGMILVNAGRHQESRKPLEESIAILEGVEPPRPLDLSVSVLWLVVLEWRSGNVLLAEPLARRVLELRRSVLEERHPDVAEALNALASVLFVLGDYAGAVSHYEMALASWKDAFGADHPQVGTCRYNLANALWEFGDFEGARQGYQEALRIRRKWLGSEHPLVADALESLAETLVELGETARARSLYEEALRIKEKTYGRSNGETGWTLMKLGRLHTRAKDYSRARASLMEASEIQEKTLGPGHPDLGMTSWYLASLAVATEDTAAAARWYRRALEIQRGALGPEHPDVGLTQSDYARFLAAKREDAAALDLALGASEIGRKHMRLTARGVAERQALSYTAMRPYGLDVSLAVVSRAPSNASREAVVRVWDALIRSRTLVLDEVAARQRTATDARADSGVVRAGEALEYSRRRLAGLLVRRGGSASHALPESVARAREDMERAERVLAARSAGFRTSLSMDSIGFAEVAASLPPECGLIAYAGEGAGSKRGYVAFVLRSGEDPEVVPLGPASEIDALVLEWIRRTTSGAAPGGTAGARAEAASRTSGAALRVRIFDPLQSRVAGARRLFIVPDGSLYRVGLAGLPVDGGGYLIETGPVIHYLSSEKDLARTRDRSRPGEGLLALGGPSFDVPPAAAPTRSRLSVAHHAGAVRVSSERRGGERSAVGCTEFASVQFQPLPESSHEVEEIASLWPNADDTFVFEGRNASEEAVRRYGPGRRVIHLATHGFFLETECLAPRQGSRGIGGVATSSKRPRPASTASGPLQLSGLALAGANLRNSARSDADDGILTSQEITSLELRSVDWAVLSACDTGLGEIQVGEGVLGLRRALQIAGVGTTILSLWAVEDQSAREWMEALYRGKYSQGLGTAEAAREASLSVLRGRRARGLSTHPSYWAGFVASGDWR